MHHLGQTRSAHRADHILQTPDTFVRAPLPGMRKGNRDCSRRTGARRAIHAIYGGIRDGWIAWSGFGATILVCARRRIGDQRRVPETWRLCICSALSTLQVFLPRLPREPLSSRSPISRCRASPRQLALTAAKAKSPPAPFMGDDALEVRPLLPDDPSFDFAVNTMTFLPGATSAHG